MACEMIKIRPRNFIAWFKHAHSFYMNCIAIAIAIAIA